MKKKKKKGFDSNWFVANGLFNCLVYYEAHVGWDRFLVSFDFLIIQQFWSFSENVASSLVKGFYFKNKTRKIKIIYIYFKIKRFYHHGILLSSFCGWIII